MVISYDPLPPTHKSARVRISGGDTPSLLGGHEVSRGRFRGLSRALQYLTNTSGHDLGFARLHHPNGYLDALRRTGTQLDRWVAFEQPLSGLGGGNLELAFVPGDAQVRYRVGDLRHK